MHHYVVRRKILGAFQALSNSDTEALISAMSPTVHHSFPGAHALGGQRHNRDEVEEWLQRLFRLFPGLTFDIKAIAVDGPPWNTTVGVEWTNQGLLSDGSQYANSGAHILTLRWGRVTSFHAYLHDGQESADALVRLAAFGIEEASAAPIGAAADHEIEALGS